MTRYPLTFPLRAVCRGLALSGLLLASCSRQQDIPATEPAPQPAVVTVARPAQDTVAAAVTDWSDAPECNAVLKRVALEVVPCLAQIDADVAREFGEWLEHARTRFRLPNDPSGRELALLRIDDGCLQEWRLRNRLIGDEARFKQCALR
jgi:hypothetical protein